MKQSTRDETKMTSKAKSTCNYTDSNKQEVLLCNCPFFHTTLLCISMHTHETSELSHVLSPRSSLQQNKLHSKCRDKPSLLCQKLPHPTSLIFKKAVDHTCSCSILGCGNHIEGNGTECVICLGAVMLRFYGNTPPGVTVTLLSFLSLPAIL